MRDLALFAHIIFGLALIALPAMIIFESKRKSSLIKPLSLTAAGVSWLLLLPAGVLYTVFYPATKTLIKAGSWPWAHAVVMETKEHWGLLLPIISTVAAWLVFTGRIKESKRWWGLVAVLSIMLFVMGRIVKMGAFT